MRDMAREMMQLRGLLRAAGLRWGDDTPRTRMAARGIVSRFLTEPRAMSMRECDGLVDEYLRGPTVSEWPIGSGGDSA